MSKANKNNWTFGQLAEKGLCKFYVGRDVHCLGKGHTTEQHTEAFNKAKAEGKLIKSEDKGKKKGEGKGKDQKQAGKKDAKKADGKDAKSRKDKKRFGRKGDKARVTPVSRKKHVHHRP